MAVTKTLRALHFEDLEPHRFEELVRELVYDFKEWQSIEATGRCGDQSDGSEAAALAQLQRNCNGQSITRLSVDQHQT